jgi:DHA1 family bicyclomycin/chloramphenicol resistance-like MFS transporter
MFFLPGAVITMATIPRLAGTAAGIGVFVQQVLGAAFAQLYGLIADGTPSPMIAATLLSATLGVAAGGFAFLVSRRSVKTGAMRS